MGAERAGVYLLAPPDEGEVDRHRERREADDRGQSAPHREAERTPIAAIRGRPPRSASAHDGERHEDDSDDGRRRREERDVASDDRNGEEGERADHGNDQRDPRRGYSWTIVDLRDARAPPRLVRLPGSGAVRIPGVLGIRV